MYQKGSLLKGTLGILLDLLLVTYYEIPNKMFWIQYQSKVQATSRRKGEEGGG